MDTEGIKFCVTQSCKESRSVKVLPEGKGTLETGEWPVPIMIYITSLFIFPSFSVTAYDKCG